mmetsp:Transcript_14113/g.47097  ORF Transcript_14113/g.47097 Transcript_14113/m.47097 type:complete len:479 (+) Transcript_14113:918-2354(+)
MDRVPDIDGRAEEGAAAGADHRPDAVDDHRLGHGVVVARRRRGLDACERGAEADDADDDDDAEVELHVLPGHVGHVHKDPPTPRVQLARVLAKGEGGVVLGSARARGPFLRIAEHRPRPGLAGPVAKSRLDVRVAVVVHLHGAVLVLTAAEPPDQARRQDCHQRDWHGGARLANGVLDASEKAHKHDKEGHDAQDRLRRDLDHGHEREVDERDARHQRIISRGRNEFPNRLAQQAAGGLHDAGEEVDGDGELERVVRDVQSGAVPVAAKTLVQILLLVQLGEQRRQVDGAQSDEGAGGVDAVGLGRDVQPAFLARESARHPSVVKVAEEQGHGGAGDAALVEQSSVAVHDGVGVDGAQLRRRRLDQDIQEEAEHEVRHAQQSGQIVEEELAEGLAFADAGPDAEEAAVLEIPQEEGRALPPCKRVLKRVARRPRLRQRDDGRVSHGHAHALNVLLRHGLDVRRHGCEAHGARGRLEDE